MTLGGFTGPFVALIGWLIGGGFSVGVGLWTAQALGTIVLSNEAAVGENDRRTATLAHAAASFQEKAAALTAPAPLVVPPPYVRASVATVATIVVAIAMGVYVWVKVVPKRSADELTAVQADYPGAKDAGERL